MAPDTWQMSIAWTIDKFRAADIPHARDLIGTPGELLLKRVHYLDPDTGERNSRLKLTRAAIDWARDHLSASGPYDSLTFSGNLLMYGGASVLWECLEGNGGAGDLSYFNASNTRIGAGDSTTAAVATQTDLVGSSTHREIVDAAPTHTDGTTSAAATVAYVATMETGDANFAWEEIGVFNASSSGRMLNRKVTSMGTKTSADTWTPTVSITMS